MQMICVKTDYLFLSYFQVRLSPALWNTTIS